MESIVIKNHQIIENTTSKNIKLNDRKLTIPEKTIYEKPLKITLLEDNHEELEINIGSNSDVKIILEVADKSKGNSDYRIKLITNENTNLKYLLIAALESKNAILTHEFVAGKDSNLDLLAGLVSDVLTAKIDVKVAGIGASVKIRAVAVSSDNNDQKIDVYMNHMAPNTFGDMTNIGIANKKGRVILNGVEKIEKGMKNSNVYQTLKGVITSDDAVVEVNPILLIDEYDIKAGHAATVGRLEEEALYYLQSRGLTKKDAEKLIINGFLRPVIDEIEDEELKERFNELVNLRI
ncbi:SufD family Fe-S cluster assembly protein [Haploplasma axanthum]|nr:SufD family Fe-S cluster assembly protein [Haploplasma axanthum]